MHARSFSDKSTLSLMHVATGLEKPEQTGTAEMHTHTHTATITTLPLPATLSEGLLLI